MGLNPVYQKVPTNDDSSEQLPSKHYPTYQSPWRKHALLILLAVGTVIAALVTAFFARPTKEAPLPPAITHCGHNADEARAQGCVYDVMMQLWMPPECYDENLTEHFLAMGNWTWWATSDASRTFSDEEIRAGNHSVVYTSADYHKTHCVFATEKLVRALRNQWPLIEQLISYDHMLHCRHKTLLTSDGKGAIAPTGFSRCATYETWLTALPENIHSSTD
jgi:hypothetical protein